MKLTAQGKFIDSSPLYHLLSENEHFAEKIEFELDLYNDGISLTNCTFLMIAINSNGEKIERALTKTVQDDKIFLTWEIRNEFTKVSGLLKLELRGEHNILGSMQQLISYQLAPIMIAPTQ